MTMTHSMLCESVVHLLGAWHDGELPYDEQIAVEGHLEVCAACSATTRELRDLQNALHREMLRDQAVHEERLPAASRVEAELAAMTEAVISRVRAERHGQLSAQFARMFEDLHFVWAGLAAFSAAATCAAIVASVLHFAPAQRADSLSGLITALAAPGSDRNPVRLDAETEFPRVDQADVMPAMLVPMSAAEAGRPMSLTIAGVLTQEGRVRHAALLSAGEYGDLDARRVMRTVNSTRFRPAHRGGAPVAVSLIWLFEQTTVLGNPGV